MEKLKYRLWKKRGNECSRLLPAPTKAAELLHICEQLKLQADAVYIVDMPIGSELYTLLNQTEIVWINEAVTLDALIKAPPNYGQSVLANDARRGQGGPDFAGKPR